jgi:hypothetical protein
MEKDITNLLHIMIYYENGKPTKNIHMHRLSLKEIVARHKRYQHSTRLLAALKK